MKLLGSSDFARFRFIGLVGVFFLVGCEKSSLAPLISKDTLRQPLQVFSNGQVVPDPAVRSTHYVVRRGDTLHGIAWRHAAQYEDLVEWNKIGSPDLITIGSVLRLVSSVDQIKPIIKRKTKGRGQIASKSYTGVTWGWPSQHRRFVRSQLGRGRGLTFKGVLGETIKAAAAGTVVYSGSGLRGYGELLIIQHAGNFLSAYGHNQKLLVSEGDFVTLGEEIATMGITESKEVNLYFEIRQKGKPVDVFDCLPKK